MFFWYSKKMHEHLSNLLWAVPFIPGFPNVLKLPDGKIATAQTKDNYHSMGWDDVTFVGEYDTYTVVSAGSVPIAE